MSNLQSALLFLVLSAVSFGIVYWVSQGDIGLSGICAVSVFAVGISKVIARSKKPSA